MGANSHREGRRSWNVDKLKEYISRIENNDSSEAGYEQLNLKQRLVEALVFGLRMNDGINLKELEKRYKCCLNQEKLNIIQYLVEGNLLVRKGKDIKTTLDGRLVVDEIAARLI